MVVWVAAVVAVVVSYWWWYKTFQHRIENDESRKNYLTSFSQAVNTVQDISQPIVLEQQSRLHSTR